MIVIFIWPAGVCTVTFWFLRLPSIDAPSGDSFEILPSRGLASALPTIIQVSSSSSPSIRTVTLEPIQGLRDAVPRLGLRAPFRGGTVHDVARAMVELAEAGLKGRARLNRKGDDERKALAPLIETIAEGRSPSDRLLAAYHGPWAGDIDKVFESQAF